jgi:aminotransferase
MTQTLTLHEQRTNPTRQKSTGMRLIVPLQGIVQGRGGLILGTLIPCALFYFFQLYIKRNRGNSSNTPLNPPSPSSSSPNLEEIPRTSSRSSFLGRVGSFGPVSVSGRASLIVRGNDSPYYIGLEKVSDDPYEKARNPDGIIQLGLSENRVSERQRVRFLIKFCYLFIILNFV